jgi:hypothetical protein
LYTFRSHIQTGSLHHCWSQNKAQESAQKAHGLAGELAVAEVLAKVALG